MRYCALLIGFSSLLAAAQVPSAVPTACPITFIKIDPTGNDSFGGALSKGLTSGRSARATDGTFFVLKIKNVSAKQIQGMKFQAAYYDATEDLNNIPVEWNWTDPVKPGQEKSFRWRNIWRDKSLLGWRVSLTKVLFEDGSKWEASSDSICNGDYWRDKKRKKATQN